MCARSHGELLYKGDFFLGTLVTSSEIMSGSFFLCKSFLMNAVVSYALTLLGLWLLSTLCVVWAEETGAESSSAVSARTLICSDCGSENSKLFDPMFNVRETTKQLILLEDHLAHKDKHCVDCVSKHLLFAEGLLEEAVTLDKKAQYLSWTTEAIKNVQAASALFAKHRFEKAQELQQMVRRTRKALVQKSFTSIVA